MTHAETKAVGAQALAVLRALEFAPMTKSKLVGKLQATMAKTHCERLIDSMIKRGLLDIKWRQIVLTHRGRKAIPSAAPQEPMRPYIPPRVVRRIGSMDFKRWPSRVGGRLVYTRTTDG